MTELTVYEVFPGSINDPDHGPDSPAPRGSWTWWRTGPHPQGRWQAMNWSEPGWGEAYAKMQADHPIMQDQALGDAGDFGNFSCHACDYFSDGYPKPDHMTFCDGICKRENCPKHGEGGKATAKDVLAEAFAWARASGMTDDEIRSLI